MYDFDYQGGEITYNRPELEKESDNGLVLKTVSTRVSGQADCKAARGLMSWFLGEKMRTLWSSHNFGR